MQGRGELIDCSVTGAGVNLTFKSVKYVDGEKIEKTLTNDDYDCFYVSVNDVPTSDDLNVTKQIELQIKDNLPACDSASWTPDSIDLYCSAKDEWQEVDHYVTYLPYDLNGPCCRWSHSSSYY